MFHKVSPPFCSFPLLTIAEKQRYFKEIKLDKLMTKPLVLSVFIRKTQLASKMMQTNVFSYTDIQKILPFISIRKLISHPNGGNPIA
jgi:hypothetical protein